MDHQRAEHLRKTATGVAMIVAPLCFLVADSVWPVSNTDARGMLADASGATGRIYVSVVLVIVGAIAFVGAILGLAHMLHQRMPGVAMVGGAVAIAGTVCIAAASTTQGLVLFEAAQPGRNATAMRGLVDALFTGSAIPIFLLTELSIIGTLVLAWGLARARVVAPWSAIALAVGVVGTGVGSPFAFKPLIYAGELLMVVGLGSIGWTVLTETDEEWASTPEFHGFGRTVTA